MHPNSGNMGLPLALLTFGSEGLALAAGFASIVMVSHFTANSAISSGNYSLKKILLSPVLLALLASLFILFYKIEMPNFINSFAKIFTTTTQQDEINKYYSDIIIALKFFFHTSSRSKRRLFETINSFRKKNRKRVV